MVIDDIKILLDINDSSTDILLILYARRASTSIRRYLNLVDTDNAELLYPDAVIQFVIEQYNKRGNEGLKNYSEGSLSGTYSDALSDSVKVLLPKPKIRMRG